MNELVKGAFSCLIGIISIFLAVAGIIYVLRRGSRRTSVAGVVGIIASVFVVLGMIAGLAPNLVDNQLQSWLVVIAVGLIFFAFALLWTYITPALHGTTWDEMTTPSRKSNKNDGSKVN